MSEATVEAGSSNESGSTPKKLNVREQQKQISQRKILDAGIALFSLKGFEGTSLADVAARAGLKKSLLMHHFETKEQLWKCCVDDIYGRVDQFFLEEYGEAAPATVADFKRMQRTYVRACFRFPGYVRIPLLEGTEDNERVRWLAERHIARHHRINERALRKLGKDARLPYNRLKYAAFKTGWIQLLIANIPLYEHVEGKGLINEKEMLKWSDQLFDLILGRRG